jgi:Na+-driven multidrug efflux pump
MKRKMLFVLALLSLPFVIVSFTWLLNHFIHFLFENADDFLIGAASLFLSFLAFGGVLFVVFDLDK